MTTLLIEMAAAVSTALASAGVLLNNRKLIGCFPLWIASNSLAAGVHLAAGVWMMVVRDAVFISLAIDGWRRWQRAVATKEIIYPVMNSAPAPDTPLMWFTTDGSYSPRSGVTQATTDVPYAVFSARASPTPEPTPSKTVTIEVTKDGERYLCDVHIGWRLWDQTEAKAEEGDTK